MWLMCSYWRRRALLLLACLVEAIVAIFFIKTVVVVVAVGEPIHVNIRLAAAVVASAIIAVVWPRTCVPV